MKLQHRQVRAGALDVHVVEGGTTEDPSILFLHGWPQDASAFTRVMEALADEAHVVAIDLPGVGGSPTEAPAGDKLTLARCVRDAAHAAFFDLGISRTSGRNGILVFVSTFEQRALVVTDFGIDTATLGADWPEACAALSSAVKRRDVPAFEAALERVGPILAATMPRMAQDVNELPDEVRG